MVFILSFLSRRHDIRLNAFFSFFFFSSCLALINGSIAIASKQQISSFCKRHFTPMKYYSCAVYQCFVDFRLITLTRRLGLGKSYHILCYKSNHVFYPKLRHMISKFGLVHFFNDIFSFYSFFIPFISFWFFFVPFLGLL